MNDVNWIDKFWDLGVYAFFAVIPTSIYALLRLERRVSVIESEKATRDDALRLHMSDHYVKKTDLDALKREFAADFAELKSSNLQILDILLQRKIGTTGRRR